MAYETLVAVYDTPPHAEAAVKALKAAGFDGSGVDPLWWTGWGLGGFAQAIMFPFVFDGR
jgi:hypothetical protein